MAADLSADLRARRVHARRVVAALDEDLQPLARALSEVHRREWIAALELACVQAGQAEVTVTVGEPVRFGSAPTQVSDLHLLAHRPSPTAGDQAPDTEQVEQLLRSQERRVPRVFFCAPAQLTVTASPAPTATSPWAQSLGAALAPVATLALVAGARELQASYLELALAATLMRRALTETDDADTLVLVLSSAGAAAEHARAAATPALTADDRRRLEALDVQLAALELGRLLGPGDALRVSMAGMQIVGMGSRAALPPVVARHIGQLAAVR